MSLTDHFRLPSGRYEVGRGDKSLVNRIEFIKYDLCSTLVTSNG